jgi:rhodanese-related sulfurtransferase
MLVLLIAAGICPAAVYRMDQGKLKGYIEKGAPFDFILIDVRNKAEIIVAIGNESCKPYNLPYPVYFMPESRKIPKDRVIIIYCASGMRSVKAAGFLSANGYSNVYDAGGIMTWAGPTVPGSEIKSLELLPEPSMRAPVSGFLRKLQDNDLFAVKRRALRYSRWMQDIELFPQSRRLQ